MKVTVNGVERDLDMKDPAKFSWKLHYLQKCQNASMMRSWLRDIQHGKWHDKVKIQAALDAAVEMGLTDDVNDILQPDSPDPAPVG